MNRKYRRPLIAGNWKMNLTPSETKVFMSRFRELLPKGRNNDVALCVPAVCIPAAVRAMRESRVSIGAENCNANPAGAYTGEISASMLLDAGCKYVILGHSERRAMGETDQEIHQKLLTVLDAGMTPILCCGESLEQREVGVTEEWISMQLKYALQGLDPRDVRRLVIAYEPIWAIGTGKTATSDQAQEIHALIRGLLADKYGAQVADDTTILYGGSCKPSNAPELFAKPDIDGGLIGGASLKAADFMGIVTAF